MKCRPAVRERTQISPQLSVKYPIGLDACDRAPVDSRAVRERRIRAFYDVQAKRVEPVGLAYLWPETN